MKKKIIIILIPFVVIVGVWASVKYWSRPVNASLPAVYVGSEAVATHPLPLEEKAIGTLVAKSVEISPELAGHLRDINFRNGSYVSEKSVLFKLDDDVYRTKYELAKAKLSFSRANYKRTALLAKKGVLAKQALEQAESDLKERKADLDEAKVMLSKMKLIAPFSGQVGKRKVNPGDYVNVGQSLVTLTDTKHLHVEYNLPEKDLSNLKIGQKVTIKTSAYPDRNFTGEVAFISPTVNPDSRALLVYAHVPNDQGLLAPGMFVNVSHSLGTQKDALMIPARSLVPILDGEQVFKIVGGRAYAVPVVIGKRTKELVQVLDGVKLGDIIVTDGQMKIKNGMPVKIKT